MGILFRLTIAFLLFLTFIGNVSAQKKFLPIEQISIENKLSSNTVCSIAQDKQGYLWFGTRDGLSRYDGYSIYTLKHNPNDPNSLSDNYITSIAVDNDGNLWIGTGNGVNKYDVSTEKITSFTKNSPKNQQLTSNIINSIYVDKNKKVWIGTGGGGLNCLDQTTNTITSFSNDPSNPLSLSNDHVLAIFRDRKSRLWITTADGINLFDETNRTFKRYLPFAKNPNSTAEPNKIYGITEDLKGNIWIGITDGLSKYDENNDNFLQHFNLTPQKAEMTPLIYSLCCDSSGIIWITTQKGILSFNPNTEKFEEYDLPPNLNNNTIYRIFFDSDGRMWVGALDGGLNSLDLLSKRFLPIRPQLNQDSSLTTNTSITAICKDSKELIWVGTRNGLYRYSKDNQLLTRFIYDPIDTNKLPSNYITRVTQGPSGLLWIGTDKGLRVYDVKLEKFITNEIGLPPILTQSLSLTLLEDSKKILWFGTNNSLYSFNIITKTLNNYQKNPASQTAISSNRIYELYEDDKGNVWIATPNGLNLYDREKDSFIVYQNDPQNSKSINTNSINSVYRSKSGTLWLATKKGLSKFDISTETFSTIPNIAALNDLIYSVLEDDHGYLWMSSNQGLIKYNPKTNNVWIYTDSDGLQSNEFNFWVYHKSPSGELFFGGVNGFNHFYPDKIKDNQNIPKIVVSTFDVLDGRTRPIESKHYLPTSGQLNFPYNQNFFNIEFSALNFTHPEKNKYAFKMEGIDQDWIYCDSTKRSARYPNLQPGEYTFRVIGSNNDGLWNNEGVSLKIIIFPPWWRTNLAYFSYLLILGSFLFGSHNYRLKILEARNKELEKKVKERTEELNLKNKQLEGKNRELAQNYEELLQLNKKANRIFAALSEALPGTILDGKYKLEDKIGAGGFGAVYRAMHLNIKRLVAVKIFSPSPGNDSVENLERFQREAISTCRVNHPNAVAVLDSGISSEGIPYLVMELLQGHTLKAELKKNGKLTLKRCAEIVIPVCKVLTKAHASGLIHRDIKPDNIFLHYTAEGEIVKVLDFGIAKLINIAGSEQNSDDLTKTGGIIGTPIYMAPERFALKDYDGRSDIYSLGIMLYEILSGRLPFQDQVGSLATIMTAHLSQDPQPIKDFTREIPDKIEAIVLATLKKSVEQRPSLEEIAKIFAEVIGIEYKTSNNIEEDFLNLQRETMDLSLDQTTVVIAPAKITPDTDQIDPSEQITLQRPTGS